MHALSEEFDATELRRARTSLETIDLRALELHIPVPAITRGTLAHTHELKMKISYDGGFIAIGVVMAT